MKIIDVFQGKHTSLVHDMKYDYFGKRIATCSSDDIIKIWDHLDGEYKNVSSWKGHNGSIWKVDWAYPGFGQILASCSFDRTVHIWEESSRENEWVKKFTFLDATKSVVDIRFAPFHLGLILSTLSSDGHIRIYEAPDAMNSGQWSMIQDIVCKGATCMAWDPSRFNVASICVGCDDGSIKLFAYKENFKTWENIKSTKPSSSTMIHDISWASTCGRSYSLIASGSKDGSVTLFKVHKTIEILEKFDREMSEVWKVEWNITGNILACSDDTGQIRLVKYIHGKWKMENKI